MFRDRTNLYLAYRKTFPHHNKRKSASRQISNNERFKHLKQEEEGLLHLNADGDIELSEFDAHSHDSSVAPEDYTSMIQTIESKGNDLTERIKQNMKKLSKKYNKVLLPQFDDEVIQGEMNAVNDLSNLITDELRMIYKVIHELQTLDAVLSDQEAMEHESLGEFKDNQGGKGIKGARILVSNLKKKFAIVSQELSGEFREMQGKYIRYLKKDEIANGSNSNDPNNVDILGNSNTDIESYSRNAMVESSKQIESQQSQLQVQLNKNELVEDQQYLLEREREIYKISQNVVEISIIFKELENIVIDQGTILDNIEYNIDRTVENVRGAHKQLNKAESYQKQTRKCKVVLFLVLLIFLFLMLLMVKPKRVDHYIHDGTNNNNDNNNNNNGSNNSDDNANKEEANPRTAPSTTTISGMTGQDLQNDPTGELL